MSDDYILAPISRAVETRYHSWRVTEPTIKDYIAFCQLIRREPVDIDGILVFCRRYLAEGDPENIMPDEARSVIDTYVDIVQTPVLDTDSDDYEPRDPESVLDLALYMELCTVARYFGRNPYKLAAEMSLRQLHYAYYVAYNQMATDTEERVLLAGGKLKSHIKRLRLKGVAETLVSTKDMSPREKAAYYSRLRRQEGREPGKPKDMGN